MRIVVDLDGTICHLKHQDESYSQVQPIPGAVTALRRLKEEGHEIIIYTARNMKTFNGNTGKVIANIGAITMDWLNKHQVPHDEIVFGKPYGDLYIDDLALAFTNWEDMMSKIQGRAT
jgi:capsule biosynthesis phosphatase